jgi:hypothetical protein
MVHMVLAGDAYGEYASGVSIETMLIRIAAIELSHVYQDGGRERGSYTQQHDPKL